jgi:hypothetical protein
LKPRRAGANLRAAGFCGRSGEEKMKRILVTAALAGFLAGPAFAQAETVTCGDYSAMDNAAQMETIAGIESLTSEMSKEASLDAAAIHEKLAADCKDQVDVLVIDVVKGYMN